jgi:hypothetical protein
VHYLVRQAKRRFLDLSLSPKILWKNLDSIGVRDKDFAPADISPDRLNSFFNSSSNVRRPKVQRSTGNFVPLLFAFSNVNSHDVFIAIHRIKAQAYQKKMTILVFVYFGTHNSKIYTFYKQTRDFVFIFSMLLFCFYSKQQQQKNRHFIYDMLCLGFASNRFKCY